MLAAEVPIGDVPSCTPQRRTPAMTIVQLFGTSLETEMNSGVNRWLELFSRAVTASTSKTVFVLATISVGTLRPFTTFQR